MVFNQGDLAPCGPLGKVWRCLGSHLERKVSWHLVGAGTHPSACRTGPVNRDPSTQSRSAENHGKREGTTQGRQTRRVPSREPRVQPHSVRASLGPIAAPCGHRAEEPASTPLTVSPGGGGGEFADTQASPSPGGLRGADSAYGLVLWAWEWDGAGRRARKHISHPHRLLTRSPLLCAPLDRPQPPSKPVVQQEDVKARSVLLSWEPGSDGLSPVRYYTVQTRELPSGRWALHSASVSHNASTFVVDR